jgi:glycosyltransferase involved in cell wall biosynthesis
MKVLLLSRYSRMGASSRLRSYQYLPFLQDNDVQVTIAPLFSSRYLRNRYSHTRGNHLLIAQAYGNRLWQLLNACSYDLIWIEKEIFPWLPAYFEKIGSIWRIPWVADYDDAIFHRYDLSSVKIVRQMLGQKIDRVMLHAGLVIAGNQYLAERAKKAGAQRVEVLPTVVDMKRYDRIPLNDNVDTERPVVIGWVGSPTTVPYLQSLSHVLGRLRRRYQIKVVNVGGGDIKMSGLSLENQGWTEDSEVRKIQRFDIGIMPLPNSLWARGKCGYKLIQYMACAKPVVASAVGGNLDIVTDGKNGLLAETSEGFYAALEKLIKDPMLRYRLGKNGFHLVKKRYCLQATAPKLLSFLTSAVNR